MEWTSKLLQLPLLCSVIFLLTGLIMYLFPPKKINILYGYRTTNSMKSIERWHFAQRFSAIKMIQSSILLGLSSFVGLFVAIENQLQLVLGIVLPLLAVFFILYTTESKLQKKFPNS